MTGPDSERIPDRVQFSKQLDRQKKKEKRQSPAVSDHLSKKQMLIIASTPASHNWRSKSLQTALLRQRPSVTDDATQEAH
jgi:hypothetical protein